MQMEMGDFLPTFFAAIDYDSVAGFSDSFDFGNFFHH
jgi:hypothetical protein